MSLRREGIWCERKREDDVIEEVLKAPEKRSVKSAGIGESAVKTLKREGISRISSLGDYLLHAWWKGKAWRLNSILDRAYLQRKGDRR